MAFVVLKTYNECDNKFLLFTRFAKTFSYSVSQKFSYFCEKRFSVIGILFSRKSFSVFVILNMDLDFLGWMRKGGKLNKQ